MLHKSKFLIILMIFSLSVLLCSCQGESDEDLFTVSVLKIGKADTIILKSENHTVVIDCGEEEDGSEITECLTYMGVDKIDDLIITHYDKDHVGGASDVVKKFDIGEIIMPDYIGTSKKYDDFINTLEIKKIDPTLLTDEMSFALDGVLYEIYPPMKTSYEESDNDFSLVVSVTHGENKLLFAGDAEKERLAELSEQLELDHDFLKMPHHGKFNGGTEAFLQSVTPEYTVITDSKKNPAENETVRALKNVGSKVYFTKDGDIHISSNGETITVSQ